MTVHCNINIIWPYDIPLPAPAGYFPLVSISVWSVLGRSGWRLMDGSFVYNESCAGSRWVCEKTLSNRGVCVRLCLLDLESLHFLYLHFFLLYLSSSTNGSNKDKCFINGPHPNPSRGRENTEVLCLHDERGTSYMLRKRNNASVFSSPSLLLIMRRNPQWACSCRVFNEGQRESLL